MVLVHRCRCFYTWWWWFCPESVVLWQTVLSIIVIVGTAHAGGNGQIDVSLHGTQCVTLDRCASLVLWVLFTESGERRITNGRRPGCVLLCSSVSLACWLVGGMSLWMTCVL